MADAKISALTALTGAQIDAAADVLAIVDTSVTTTKKVTIGELASALGFKTTVASATSPDIFATSVGPTVDYTGTTTATSFVAAPQAGGSRTLVCAGAAPFTASANMLIQGVASGSTFTAEAGDILKVFAVTTTQFRLTIFKTNGGPIVGQFKFPATQNASSDANTLDDYEEGQYIPTDNSGAGLVLSLIIDYVKIGRMVFCSLSGSYATTADASSAQFSIPFTCAKTGSGVLFHGGGSTGARLFVVPTNPANCIVYATAPGAQLTNADLSNSAFVGSFTYQTT